MSNNQTTDKPNPTPASDREDEYLEVASIDPARPFTAAGRRYLEGALSTWDLFHFFLHLAMKLDYGHYILSQILEKADRSSELEGEGAKDNAFDDLELGRSEHPPMTLALQKPGPAVQKLRSLKQTFLEMILVRLIDNFTTFISESIRSAIEARPGLVKSTQEVRLEYVLGFSSMEQLLRDLIDRKVSDLGYKGLSELDSWLSKHTGLKLFADEAWRDCVQEAIETRNCIVHARGIVGSKYEASVTVPKAERGSLRRLGIDDLYAIYNTLQATVLSFDDQVAVKFCIDRSPLSPMAPLSADSKQ